MVPTIVLNPYLLSSSGFEFYYSIKKYKKSVGLGLSLRTELRVKLCVLVLFYGLVLF